MKFVQKYTPIRFSHITSYAGVGAIVQGAEDRLMVLLDTRYWLDKQGNSAATKIDYVTRVTMVLGIDKELHMPPSAQETDQGLVGSDLPALLFPRFTVCKKCGLLHNNPWRKQDKKLAEKVYCQSVSPACKGLLEQVTWCMVSSKGNMAEVPWHYICHLGSKRKCEPDYSAEYLRLSSNQNGKRTIHCLLCGSQHTFEKIKGLSVISQPQPWLFTESPTLEADDSVEILDVNNPGTYIPVRENALVIPPESRMSRMSVIDRLYQNSALCREIDAIRIPLRRKSKLKTTARELHTTVSEVENALQEIKAGYPHSEEIIIGELKVDEYKAFLTPLENQKEDEDFVTEHFSEDLNKLSETVGLSNELVAITNSIDHLIAAKRLREIQVFKGFFRLSSEYEDNITPPDIVGESDWLPAIELFGEGVFFSLNEKLLGKWESQAAVIQRADEIAVRYETADINLSEDINVTPRFILLHTLAHLLIRELEATSGYPAASLSERIYCSRAENNKMSGILIYTAVADIAGSLGGVINSAEPTAFLSIMDNVFKKAQWCSLDPVCTEHEGQGPGWLNRAACHACSLIPEPSCECSNVFLDRVFIKGSKEKGIPAFLDFVMNHKSTDNHG